MNKKRMWQWINVIIGVLTFVLVFIGWSISDAKHERILKENLEYEINVNIRIIDDFLDNSERIREGDDIVGRLAYEDLEKYREIERNKDLRDKMRKIIEDMKNYNRIIEKIDADNMVGNSNVDTEISNANLIKSNLVWMNQTLFN